MGIQQPVGRIQCKNRGVKGRTGWYKLFFVSGWCIFAYEPLAESEAIRVPQGFDVALFGRAAGMRAFINTSNPGNVVFNFTKDPIKDLTAFALGYRGAADRLATEFSRSAPRPDYEGYPILYLYRHSLELYLKAIVYRSAGLMGLMGKGRPDVPRLFNSHKLSRLIPPVRAVFNAMQWNFEFEGSEFASFDEFERFIATIDSIDADSFAFRYPVNRRHQAILPHHYVINVVSFAEIMDSLLGYLEGAAHLIEENFQAATEASYELQQYLASEGEE